MSFFASKSSATQYRLIVSFEPHSVAVGLTLINSSKLEYIDRHFITYGKRPSMKQMQTRLSAIFREVMIKLLRSISNYKIVGITCIHSSAWSLAETHAVDLQFQNPTKILEKSIIENVHKYRSKNILSIEGLELVYHHIQKIKINGYYSENPWGKMAQCLSCDLIEGYVDTMMKKFAEDELLRYAPSVVHVPEGFVILNAARSIISDQDEVLIVHVGGETTELILASKDFLKQTASIPMGISSLVRASAGFLHGNEALALSHISLAAKGYRIPTKKEQVAIKNCVEDWRNNFFSVTHVLCNNNIPEHIYYFAAVHNSSTAQFMLDPQKIAALSGKKHKIERLFGKKTFQHDFIIAAGANYIVE